MSGPVDDLASGVRAAESEQDAFRNVPDPSSVLPCPECGKSDMVGVWETRSRCVDVVTRSVVADEHVSDDYLECGHCMHQWGREALRVARQMIGGPF